MNSLPVIVRELRAEARNPATHWMRFGAAAALLGVLAFAASTAPALAPATGHEVFRALHIGLQMAIWILVPLMTADCISRERRENTLGLLFLTPLGALDIVVAKSLVHALRAVLLWLASLPILAVPLLMGWVSGTMVLCSVMVNGTALCWALTAGLLASAFGKQRMPAVTVAGGLAFSFFLLAGVVCGLSLTLTLSSYYGDLVTVILTRGLEVNFTLGSWSLENLYVPPGWRPRGLVPPVPALAMNQALLITCVRPAALAAVSLAGAMLIAGRAIRLNWQDKPPSARYLWFLRVFCEPLVWRAFFRRWIRRKLERNPLGWLEQRSWVGRTAVGAWVAVVASFYIAIFGDAALYRRVMTEMQFLAGFGLALAMAVVAAGSFRRERELGVMELLLITPQTEAEIALGRLKGIWEQFAPAMALLLGVWLWASLTLGDRREWQMVVFFAATFAHVPVAGLYQSLKQRGFLSALLWTLLVSLFLPLGLARLQEPLWRALFAALRPDLLDWLVLGLSQIGALDVLRLPMWLLPIGWQLGSAWWHWRRLRRVLATRSFPIEVQ